MSCVPKGTASTWYCSVVMERQLLHVCALLLKPGYFIRAENVFWVTLTCLMAPNVLQYGGKMGNKKSDETRYTHGATMSGVFCKILSLMGRGGHSKGISGWPSFFFWQFDVKFYIACPAGRFPSRSSALCTYLKPYHWTWSLAALSWILSAAPFEEACLVPAHAVQSWFQKGCCLYLGRMACSQNSEGTVYQLIWNAANVLFISGFSCVFFCITA